MKSLAISGLATNKPTDVRPVIQPSGGCQLTAGLHKLLGQTIFLLLTEPGSIVGLKAYGVNAVELLGSVSLLETLAVDRLLNQIAGQLTDQLRRLTASLPDDERLGSLIIKASRVEADDLLYVELELTSAAGETAVYDLTLLSRRLA